MRKTLSRILTVLIIMNLSLLYAFAAYAGDDGAAAQTAPETAVIKIYSKDSSQGKVINGGAIEVDVNAAITSMGNRIDIEGVKNCVYVKPGDGYVFDGWENLPENNRVKDGQVILAKFRPVGLDTTSNVSATVAKECKDMGSIVPTSNIKVLTNAEVQQYGSTVLIAREGFSAQPKAGAVFSHWEGLPADGTIHSDTAITAVFEIPDQPVTISFIASAYGGSFVSTTGSMDITMPAGADIKIDDARITLGGKEYVMAIPYADYAFAGWSGIPENGCLNTDITIAAAFTPTIHNEKNKTYSYSSEDGTSFNTDQKYGTMDEPVTDGLWVRDNDSSWRYDWHVPMANAWGCLDNPYANEDQPGHGWFFFDRTGTMQTGWRVINNKWYYFEPISNGCKGQLYASTTTPDGYTVDENGVRTE